MSKYGNVGPPIHVQEVDKHCEPAAAAEAAAAAEPSTASEPPSTASEPSTAAAAEPSGAQLPSPAADQAAAAGPSDEAPPSAAEPAAEEPPARTAEGPPALTAEEPLPVGPAPTAEEPPAALSQAGLLEPEAELGDAEMTNGPDHCPEEGTLQNMKPPAPASPAHEDPQGAANTTAEAVPATTAVAPAAAAQHRIQARLLALARDIRRPRTYVGYSAFLLMGLLKRCRPCAWEGANFIDLLEVFAPWATETCTRQLNARAIPCALVAQSGGSVALAPISEEHPLSKTCHYVAGIVVPECKVTTDACSFEALYASLGVAVMASVVDGDCGLDVMTMMLGIAPSAEARADLRIEISDYLIARIGETWLHDLMVACQELPHEDVKLYREWGCGTITPPIAPAPAAAELVVAVAEDAEPIDEAAFAAMRWATHLNNDGCLLRLIRSLPKEIVEEQVIAHRRSKEAAAAAVEEAPRPKIGLCPRAQLRTRMQVAQRFHMYCRRNAIAVDKRMPYGAIQTFIKDNIEWKKGLKVLKAKTIKEWHKTWQQSFPAAADTSKQAPSAKSLLKSRAPTTLCKRQNAPGQGPGYRVVCVRQGLYEWFTSVRYAIDWRQLIAENRSRGKKHLARFPQAFLKLKAQQLMQEYCYACLLNGIPAAAVQFDSWWFRRWEEEYGLSMKAANRKYTVPRHIVKERLEIFWVTLFRVRLLMQLALGYDPEIWNPDQSPFHHNETGSQNKATLAVRGSIVPVVEGNSDVKSRWTGFFTTQSQFSSRSRGDKMPPAECMFKAEADGPVDARLQSFIRSRGFPSWLTVTVGPRGSYREHDIIVWLRKHLEPMQPGRRWRIILLDDYVCHKTQNVWNLCWSRGYVRIVHGGGTTPVSQTPDTDLNEHARRRYGAKEAALLLEKMRDGQPVPVLTHEECLLLMLEVLSDPELHLRAAGGYKKVGQTVAVWGGEDELICREAGTYWNEETTDGYTSMRPKINAELTSVEEEFKSKGLQWSERNVKRLISAYPTRKEVDKVLKNLEDDYYHDELHSLEDADGAAAAGNVSDSSEEDIDAGDGAAAAEKGSVGTALAAAAGEGAEGAEGPSKALVQLSASQADTVHAMKSTMASLESVIEHLRGSGQVRAVQQMEAQLKREKRRVRAFIQESPAVAEAFSRLRRAEEDERAMANRIIQQRRERIRDAEKAIAEKAAAAAELRETKRKIQELEGIGACRHAMKTFTLEGLGKGSETAGGPKGRKNRFEVLDRMARTRAGLSAGQKNDWAWFKEAWDKEMVKQHRAAWGETFAKWMQKVLEEEKGNAFSAFVYTETCRVFHGTAALHVPGG